MKNAFISFYVVIALKPKFLEYYMRRIYIILCYVDSVTG